jgi:hypothetical protein
MFKWYHGNVDDLFLDGNNEFEHAFDTSLLESNAASNANGMSGTVLELKRILQQRLSASARAYRKQIVLTTNLHDENNK